MHPNPALLPVTSLQPSLPQLPHQIMEAAISSSLSHPNVVQVWEPGWMVLMVHCRGDGAMQALAGSEASM